MLENMNRCHLFYKSIIKNFLINGCYSVAINPQYTHLIWSI
jgi:hypothetical protein